MHQVVHWHSIVQCHWWLKISKTWNKNIHGMNTGVIWNPVSIWNVKGKTMFLCGMTTELLNIMKKFQKDRFSNSSPLWSSEAVRRGPFILTGPVINHTFVQTSKGCVCLPGHIRHPDGRCIWYEAWCSTLFWENNGNCGENEFYTDCKHDNGHAVEIFRIFPIAALLALLLAV